MKIAPLANLIAAATLFGGALINVHWTQVLARRQAELLSSECTRAASSGGGWINVTVQAGGGGAKTLTLVDSGSGEALWVEITPRIRTYLWRRLFEEGAI